MEILDVFFDYACPYCMRAHGWLKELLPAYPQVKVQWHPCESHPRPDRYGPHSDLCIQGYFFAADHGVDLWAYHDRMYQAALKEQVNVESVDALSHSVRDLLDAEAFRQALRQGTYRQALEDANTLAYDQSDVWVVPAYRTNGRKLDPVEDVGVSKEQLRRFLGGTE